MAQNREPLLTSQILIIFVEYRDVVGDWQMQPFGREGLRRQLLQNTSRRLFVDRSMLALVRL